MATLVSPGIAVSIIDESFYTSAGQGTVPLIIMATAANKTTPSGDVAPYSLASQAGRMFLATSQRELVQNFGTPTFKIVGGTPVHGYELNEYGLNSAYSYLGIANQCFVLRADIDLAQLEPATTQPVSPPVNGTYWFDLASTSFGVFLSNGNSNAGLAWRNQAVLYAGSSNVVASGSTDVPSPSFGSDGNFAVVVTMSDNLLYEKISGSWYQVGSEDWMAMKPTVITGMANPASVLTTDTLIINTTTVSFTAGALADVVAAINDAAIPNITASISSATALVITDASGADILLNNGAGTPLATLGLTAGITYGVSYQITNDAQYPANTPSGSVWIKGTTPNAGAKWAVKYYNDSTSSWVTASAPFYPYNSTLNDGNVVKDQAATTAFGTPLSGTLYVGYDVANGTQQLRRWNGTSWANLSYEAGSIAPTAAPTEGTYWYNTDLKVDIMYGNGRKWVGYKNKFPATDPAGVILDGSKPTEQSDGTALVDNDLWIDTSDLENYPMLYRYDTSTSTWNLIDKTDQTTPFGIVFADVRQDSGTNFTGNTNNGSYAYGSTATADLLVSDFVDPDAPEPTSYPDGVLVFNARASTYNVKEWKPNYFKSGGFSLTTDYTYSTYTKGSAGSLFPVLGNAGRWVTASGNSATGTPIMGRKAQRVIIVRAMASMIASNEDIRSEVVYFNLLAAPGYPELMDEMISLNTDQKNVAFIVGDTPSRLKPTGTDILNWATNKKAAVSNGEDGLTSADPYTGVYYPWGLTTALDGSEIVVPPSHMALNTIAQSDQVAYPWFAPAGSRRGLINNATSVGYISSEGEFVPTILNNGQRDTLYSYNINPISYVPNKGLMVFGQKTLNGQSSALDSINVARLVNYVRYKLDNLLVPFLFEQNDEQTREAARNVVVRFFNGLLGLRALEDYAVVCDESNNYAERRNRKELWIDIAITPVKSIEFIYVPVRILASTDATTA